MQCEEPTPMYTTLTTVVITVFFQRRRERYIIYIEEEEEKTKAKIRQIRQILPKKNFFCHIGQIENKSKKGAKSA